MDMCPDWAVHLTDIDMANAGVEPNGSDGVAVDEVGTDEAPNNV